MKVKHSRYVSNRNPADAVEAALKTVPNQYEVVVIAAQRARELGRGNHRIDRALMDVANGVANAKTYAQALQRLAEQKEKLKAKGK